MKQGLNQVQVQRQRLLPGQLRLISLLEAGPDEIEQEVRRELDENPALERVSHADDDSRLRSVGRGQSDQPDFQPVQADAEPTLREHLLGQLAEQTELPDAVRQTVVYMLGALDSNGYLTRTLPQLGDDLELDGRGVDGATLRQAYATLRSLDPAGVGAQDLRDCLVLQLKRMDPHRPEVRDALEITSYFFDLYSRRNFKALSADSDIPIDRVNAANDLILTLNPKPGAPFASDSIQALGNAAVTPDFMVETDGERLTVSMLNSLPELQIEESFLRDEGAGEAAGFIRDRRNQARSFIDLLARRQHTLMAIARAIVRFQADFFTSGDDDSRIHPMVLRQVAEATGLELSMVSRAVSGKWLATAWGVYPLKYFFNHRTGADDEETSAREIEAALRSIIADETTPLSDEALAAELLRRGYKVARRTVAKYRTNLGIPSARFRH